MGLGGELLGGFGGSMVYPLTIDPPFATIDVVDGVITSFDFDSVRGPSQVGASWQVDLSSVATIDSDGLVTPTGTVGGEVTIEATSEGEKAQAKVAVQIKSTKNPGNLGGNEIALLDAALANGAAADGAVAWAYPYDKTVFPKGLAGPELMWANATAGDAYLLQLKGPYTEQKIFLKADPPSRFQLDAATWELITESGKGGAVQLKLLRLPAGSSQPTLVAEQTYTIANGSLRGSVYYWAKNLGRVLRIKPGQSGPEDFLLAGGQNGCSTCHTVSANGSTLVIGGDINVSTWDLQTNTAVLSLPSVGKPVRNWAMPAVSPNGAVVIENNAPLPGPPGGSDGMFDAKTGMKLANTGLEGVKLDMPAFSPNSAKIAYVDHATKALGAYDFDPILVLASNPIALIDQGATPIAFPTMSPDGQWIVYHRGSLDSRYGFGDLYMSSSTVPGMEVPLDNASGTTYPFWKGDRDRHYNYEPTFAPLASGGFFWVVFTSRRTYGNRLLGTKNETQQLWVSAIDQTPQAGTDASHPPFHLDGQELNTWNMRGYWALDPCKPEGSSCGTGSECCNQNCVGGVCEMPDPNECAETGNYCEVDGDCCDPLAKCINHICSEPPPA
jgi:hypothetical protein